MYGALPTVGGAPGGTTVPYVWLHCNGAAVSRFDYATLFGIIGESFGPGNGSTTFNVPDLRQRFPLGVAASGTGNVLGSTGGAIDHTHSGPTHTHAVTAHTHSMAAHTHVVPRDGWGNETNIPAIGGRLQTGDAAGTGPGSSASQATASNVSGASAVTDTAANTVGIVTEAGGTAATGSNNPPFVAVHFIIKT
jgi:microcystin-dependent protein